MRMGILIKSIIRNGFHAGHFTKPDIFLGLDIYLLIGFALLTQLIFQPLRNQHFSLFGLAGLLNGLRVLFEVLIYGLNGIFPAKALIDAGALVPDEIVEGMIESEFKSAKDVAGFLLDGFPRNTAQAEDLDAILAKSGEEVSAVVSLMIPDEMIKERIRHRAAIEGRADDASEETINNRIATYHGKTEPLIGYYKNTVKYHEVDGTGTIDDVREKIFGLMDRF